MALTNAERQRRHRERKQAEAEAPREPKHNVTGTKDNEARNGWQGTDDLVDFLESLPRVQVGRDGYEEKDRAADFITAFSSEAGRRVLAQIALICDPPALLGDADRPGVLAMKAGMRLVMNHIQRCFVVRAPIVPETRQDQE